LFIYHQACLLQVTVLEARDIPRMDKMGTSDAHVELFTDPGRRVATKTKKNTLTPKWENEIHFLMVQVCCLLHNCSRALASLWTQFPRFLSWPRSKELTVMFYRHPQLSQDLLLEANG
jgi:hypothetical protein